MSKIVPGPQREMEVGSRGGFVNFVLWVLACLRLGAHLPEGQGVVILDGRADRTFRRLVELVQMMFGIERDGKFGPRTRELLAVRFKFQSMDWIAPYRQIRTALVETPLAHSRDAPAMLKLNHPAVLLLWEVFFRLRGLSGLLLPWGRNHIESLEEAVLFLRASLGLSKTVVIDEELLAAIENKLGVPMLSLNPVEVFMPQDESVVSDEYRPIAIN